MFDEAADYYIDRRWALGPGGKVYAPMSRDHYEISEFDASGELLQVFGRKDRPRRRTQAEKDEISPLINVNFEDDHAQWTIADHDECVTRVLYSDFLTDDGRTIPFWRVVLAKIRAKYSAGEMYICRWVLQGLLRGLLKKRFWMPRFRRQPLSSERKRP